MNFSNPAHDKLSQKNHNKGVERWFGEKQNQSMEFLKFLIGSRSARHKGSGVPSGRLLEVRAVFFLLIALFLGIAGWTWMKKAENYSYTSPKIEQISTAAGKN
jgi:hypothetical protein